MKTSRILYFKFKKLKKGEIMKKNLYSVCATVIMLSFLLISSPAQSQKDYHHDDLAVTEKVKTFILDHNITGSDLDKIHRIIEIMHDKLLFIRVKRSRIQGWLQEPEEIEVFKSQLRTAVEELRQINYRRLTALLSKDEYEKRKELQEFIFYGMHDLSVYSNVIQKKDIYPQDLPFVVSGAEAVEYGIADGCTTATKTFIVLAKAAGIKEVRFVPTGNVLDYNKACQAKGKTRKPGITINGHFFALAKIQGKWALVNCTYFEPYSLEDSIRYEIFFELDGEEVSPEMLTNRILKIPSFQREGKPRPPSRLYVIGVGKDNDDDLDIENYKALMNMSVSGDRDCAICKCSQF
jgi:hypothetical protein